VIGTRGSGAVPAGADRGGQEGWTRARGRLGGWPCRRGLPADDGRRKIDETLQDNPSLRPWRPAVGITPKLSDAELLTLAVVQALPGHVSEARWLRYARATLGHLVPYLPGQSGDNKRLRAAAPQLVAVIRALAVDTELWADTVWVADSSMDLEGLEGLDGLTLAARIEANRRTVMPPVTPPPAPPPRDLQEADQARAFQAAWEAGWNAGRSAGWQQGWDLHSAVDVVVLYMNSAVDL
jgi:hypothetical protein